MLEKDSKVCIGWLFAGAIIGGLGRGIGKTSSSADIGEGLMEGGT